MAKGEKHFRLSPDVLDYLNEKSTEWHCTQTEVFERIVREHKTSTVDEAEYISEAVINKFEDKYKNLFTRLRLATDYTDKNVQTTLEILNSMLFFFNINTAVTSHRNKTQVWIDCENEVKRKIAEYKQYNDSNKK